jgi:hypothetical protein
MIICKQLGQRHFLKSGDRDDLQGMIQTPFTIQAPVEAIRSLDS